MSRQENREIRTEERETATHSVQHCAVSEVSATVSTDSRDAVLSEGDKQASKCVTLS